jgi:hypothetical protein
MVTVAEHIDHQAAAYGRLPLFEAFRQDNIPLDRFADFFKEQYLAARLFQDLIWATTEIHEGPYAAFAAKHRLMDSGHHLWMKQDLANFGLAPMTTDDFFRLEFLPTRIQMARILALCHNAAPEKRMVILAALESAGDVTLGTLFGYVARHGLLSQTGYLGQKHIDVEKRQVAQIHEVAHEVLDSDSAYYKKVVDEVFDALTVMFGQGGDRYYQDYLYASDAATCPA